MKNKLLASILTACMLLTMLPTAAFAAEVTEQNPVLPDGVEFKEENTVYYDGEYYDKLTDALKAAAGKEGAILYCKPGADVGKMTHGHVCASLTVYGNGAFVSGGENDFEVDTYKGTSCAAHNNCPGLQGDLNITINDLNCSGVWGQRTSEHTINIVMNNCKNADRVYLSGETGVNNITITGNTYIGSSEDANESVTGGCAIYSTADGEIEIDGCQFDYVKAPINLNHKDNGKQSVTVSNTTFNNCALLNDLISNNEKSYISPIRVLTTNKDGSSALTVDHSTFNYTASEAKANGDILIGDGRADAKVNSNVTVSISNTAAEVQFQAPGYHAADGGVADKTKMVTMTADGTGSLNTSLDEAFAVAKIGDTQYFTTLADAITAAGQMMGDVTITLLDDVDVSDSSARTYDLSASSLSGLTIRGASQDVQIISGVDGHGIDGPTYCPVLSVKLPENAPLTIENVTAPNDLLFDTAENGTLVVRNCVFNGAQSGYPKAESISYLNNTFEFKGTADNFYSYNAYPVWYKVNNALDFVFEGNTVIGYRGVHIETRGSDASKQVNISVNNNHFTLEDADHETKEVALQLVNHLNGNISFSNNHVDGYMGVCFYKDIVVEKDTKLTIQNNDTTGKLYGSSEWNAAGATPEEQEAAADAFAESVINGIPEEDKNIAAGHTEHHYVDGTCTICGKKEPAPVEPDGPSSDNERTYAIVTEDDGNGSVTVSADEASAGTRITVTVKPDAGYELDELTVTDAKNKDLKVTKRSETTYTFHMADSKVTVEASFTKDGTVQKPDTRFDDVAKSAWYYKAVEYVAENGIMSGVSAREFAPNAGFSRAMLAQTLYAMSGKPTVKAEGTFADVAANAWYADAVNWAAEKGYVSGVGDGKFAPDASITREQMALILYRYAGSPDASGMVLREFADGESVSAYAVDAIRWAVHEGLISGMENNTLAPQGTATRAQVAQILMNFHQKLDK